MAKTAAELMPAKSKAQQRLMAIAEHDPGAVKAKNRGVLKMTHQELHDFAATRRRGLPARKKREITTESHSYDNRKHRGGRKPKK